MKLIKQTLLAFQDNKSDKVYEVDLCDVGNNQYVVNFRYGKRGATLKASTKTIFPVAYQQAITVFDKLVASKVKKGYWNTKEPISKTSQETQNKEIKSTVILTYLTDLLEEGKWRESWNLTRVIWRVGELKLKAAAPLILRILKGEQYGVIGQLVRNQEMFLWYSAIWALCRCEEKQAAPLLQKLAKDVNQAPPIQRFASQGALMLSEGESLLQMEEHLIEKLPSRLRELAQSGTVKAINKVLFEYLVETNSTANEFISTLYILSYTKLHIREAMGKLLPELPFIPNHFKHIRHIFKLAELREDFDTYALIAYGIEQKPAGFNSDSYYARVPGDWVTVSEEIKKPTSRLAFSKNTKEYFRRKTLRILHKLGSDQQESYVSFASQLLLTITDKDMVNTQRTSNYSYDWDSRNYNIEYFHFDDSAPLQYLNQILYTNSPRYEKTYSGNWMCKGGYEPGKPAPESREEAYPELWDSQPEAYIQLLTQSKCARVHEFALRALNQHPKANELVNLDIIQQLLGSNYPQTLNFALDKARSLFDPNQNNRALILALALSMLEEARHLAIEWIAAQDGVLLKDLDFTTQLLFSPYEDMRSWVRKTLPLAVLSTEESDQLLSLVIAQLTQIDGHEEAYIQGITKTIEELILSVYPKRLASLKIEQLIQLLTCKSEAIQALAGSLIIQHPSPSHQLPNELFKRLLDSEYPSVQSIGIQLFGTLPIDVLLQQQELIISFATSKVEEARNAIQPIIGKLAKEDKNFAHQVIEGLIPILLKKERIEGLHQSIFYLLSEELLVQLQHINKEGMWKLLRSRYEMARVLGSTLFSNHIDINTLSIKEIVELAGHELIQLRQSAWEYYTNNVARMKYEREAALKLLESDWDDTRTFAFDFFKKEFNQEDWTPKLLVSICDSVREDVQTFGYTLITLFFEEKDGLEYLLKLSQHPTAKLQLFATNYLERFASGDFQRLKKLELYFITVLSQVNKARIAKDRVFKFLHEEASKDLTIAQFVYAIMKRQVNTIAKGDKATCIAIMSDLLQQYPTIGNTLKVKKIRTYTKA